MEKEGFMSRVLKLIRNSNIVVEVVDARFSAETRHPYLERKVLDNDKKLIIVMNKADLLSKDALLRLKREMAKVATTVFISARSKKGVIRLREEIGKAMKTKDAKIGIIGYPNVGKSTLVNALSGRHAAPTSIKAGFTRGEQYVRISEHIVLTDTPGIIPFDEK
ncbi:MAG: GTPase, partial [Candidatus Diapherotrites archaeon]|nr:GTPase [Candidatus Diapherotrites archaeon]